MKLERSHPHAPHPSDRDLLQLKRVFHSSAPRVCAFFLRSILVVVVVVVFAAVKVYSLHVHLVWDYEE